MSSLRHARRLCHPPRIPCRTTIHLNLHSRQFQTSSAGQFQNVWIKRTVQAGKIAGYLAVSSAVGVGMLIAGLFAHDALTYTDKHVDRVPVAPLALKPETGGPKNLPIVSTYINDEEDEEAKQLRDKPKLVIVGGGWGSVGVLNTIQHGDYHVTIVADQTFTTFTPLLPSAVVGTVNPRTLVEPLRKMIARLRGHFIRGKAIDLVIGERLLEVETDGGETGQNKRIYVPYDKLIIAVGSTSSTHGVPGLEHCFQLKTITDARAMRRRILDNFETAALPTTSPEERKRLLSFVVCGGGPTGVETAAEIYDFCQEDIMNYYPRLCREEVSIHLIQSRGHILNTYSEAISNFAEEKFKRDNVDVITNARVSLVNDDSVIYTKRDPDTGETTQHTLPTNFILWSTGIAMNPFTQRVSNLLPNQVHRKAIVVDSHLRVLGAPKGQIFAIGDCATVDKNITNHLMELVEEADRNKDGKIDFDEWEYMVSKIKIKVPMADKHLEHVRQLFESYDSDADDSLTLNELVKLLEDVSNKITALPATAQVASQQGKYIGKMLHKNARLRDASDGFGDLTMDDGSYKPFRYYHLGSLAYIGNAAVFDFGQYTFMGGLAAMYAWRSAYWNEQVSSRTRALLMIDWVIRGIWGRDLSRL